MSIFDDNKLVSVTLFIMVCNMIFCLHSLLPTADHGQVADGSVDPDSRVLAFPIARLGRFVLGNTSTLFDDCLDLECIKGNPSKPEPGDFVNRCWSVGTGAEFCNPVDKAGHGFLRFTFLLKTSSDLWLTSTNKRQKNN